MLAHAALLLPLVLLQAPSPPRGPDLGVVVVSLYDGPELASSAAQSAPPAAPPPAPPFEPPPDVEPQFLDVELAEADLAPPRDPLQDPVALSVAGASGAAGETCAVGAWLQPALQGDPEVLAALGEMPRSARSVADALMLWDGVWVAPRPGAARAVAPIRAALISGVGAAPEACLAQVIRGPELITLENGATTTVLAIGSGEWKWGDLLSRQQAGSPEAQTQSLVNGWNLLKLRQIIVRR